MSRMNRLATTAIGALLTTAAILVIVWWRPSTPDAPELTHRVVVLPLPSPSQAVRQTAAASDRLQERVVPSAVEDLGQPTVVRSGGSDLDPRVRRLVAAVSSHPRLISLLAGDGLLERFVAAVEAVASGYSPRRELAALNPHQPFLARHEGQGLVIAESSFHRYDAAVDLLTSVDPAAAVAVLDELAPELEAIHRRMAWSDEPFSARLAAALDHLLQVEIPQGPYAVEAGEVSWRWSDGRLERLSAAQQHLLRLGPDNARRLQATLAQVRARLADRTGTSDPMESAAVDASSRSASAGGFLTSAAPTLP